MMRLIPVCCLFFLLFLSCKNRSGSSTVADTSKALAKDSPASSDDPVRRLQYVERGHLELPDYSVTLTSMYLFPKEGPLKEDSSYYFGHNFLIVAGKRGKSIDTTELDLEDMSRCISCHMVIRDLTDNLHFPSLVVQIVTPGEDIYYENTFVGYQQGKLEELFKLEDTDENGVRLQRANDSTLSGFTSGRDEVVDALEHNFPVVIDPRTFKVSYPRLEMQYIGFETDAVESFRAHRVINNQVDSSLYSVKAGTPLVVDTFYRVSNKVRLRIADSVLVEVKMETANKKIRHLIAG
jgi:hypothetical protein